MKTRRVKIKVSHKLKKVTSKTKYLTMWQQVSGQKPFKFTLSQGYTPGGAGNKNPNSNSIFKIQRTSEEKYMNWKKKIIKKGIGPNQQEIASTHKISVALNYQKLFLILYNSFILIYPPKKTATFLKISEIIMLSVLSLNHTYKLHVSTTEKETSGSLKSNYILLQCTEDRFNLHI